MTDAAFRTSGGLGAADHRGQAGDLRAVHGLHLLHGEVADDVGREALRRDVDEGLDDAI